MNTLHNSDLTKLQIANQITDLLGLERVHFSTGSSEPRELFERIISTLGLGEMGKLTKPQCARHIVESAGLEWEPIFESNGGTVTVTGLLAVLAAVKFFLG